MLQKPGPLTRSERRLMQTHTVLGEQMLGGVAFLRGEGLRIVRSHHERWDGHGHRPYRRARGWDRARAEILRESGGQFDPEVVSVFREREASLRLVRRELAAA